MKIYEIEKGKPFICSARIRSWGDNDGWYCLVKAPNGVWSYEGERVHLASIHGSGEVRWYVGSSPYQLDKPAIAHFGLVEVARA